MFKSDDVSCVDKEIKRYLDEEREGKNADPLRYWYLKESTYPSLARMAKKYLAVPSTSTPSERAFSNGRLVIPHTRASMKPSTLRACMCLNNWFSNGFIVHT